MNQNLQYLLLHFLKKYDIHIHTAELKLQLLSHPSYPSLHSVTGVLSHFNIENVALEVPTDKETLYQLPDSFLSLTELNGSKEYVIVSRIQDKIELVYSNQSKEKIGVDNFLDIWSGIIVVIEKDEKSVSEKPVRSTELTKYFFLGVFGIVLCSLFFMSEPSVFQYVHFLLTLVGLTISVLIVNHELGVKSKFTDAICASTSATSCEEVLNSKGATLFGNVKLSDLSLVYFATLAIAWVLYRQFNVSETAILFITVLSVFATIYSLFYQKVVLQKWCPLCLGIVAVIWLQCAVVFLNWENTEFLSSFIVKSGFILFLGFLMVATLWLFVRPLAESASDLEKLQIDHYKFKRNFELFNAVHEKNELINTDALNAQEITLGVPNAPLRLLLVTNPSCYYCKAAHTDMEHILSRYPDQVRIVVRFNVLEERSGIAYDVAHRLIELYNTVPFKTLEIALREAYKEDADLPMWLLKWGNVQSNSFRKLLKAQNEWCSDNHMFFTPALFVNGRLFPKEYERSDITYFMEDLTEQVIEETKAMEKAV